MGVSTRIEWADHTFNPWWGCQKVSPACEHCYAETLARRFGYAIWGPPEHTPRRFFGPAHWQEPLKWNAQAEKDGVQRRVFCASMADVFEDGPVDGGSEMDSARDQLWRLITRTPELIWMLLTKRPHNILKMVPSSWWMTGGAVWPDNVWVGTTVEDQRRANERIPELLAVPARVRFVSCEPLLGLVDLSQSTAPSGDIAWVIAGGESGPGARPMDPDWARDLRDRCVSQGVAYFFKQWGEWYPQSVVAMDRRAATALYRYPDETPQQEARFWARGTATIMRRVGKKAAGRLLDGREWNEVPA